MVSHIEIGQYIQKLRKEKGLSQKSLSEHLSISFQAVSKWETGESLPDVGILIDLADILETTTDKILSAGQLVLKKHKFIQIDNIVEGFKALENLRFYFGEQSAFYQGAIEGINKKMNIDFEHYIKHERYKETMLAEVIIQYLMNGYHIEREDIDLHVNSEKLRNIIYKYLGEESQISTLFYQENPKLFDQIRKIKEEFKKIDKLAELPGEYIRLEQGKMYWCAQIEVSEDFCYGIAVDENSVSVFSYNKNGENQKLIHRENRTD
ncbi:MAG: helix-turn-helix transcriptional regulator [Acholeplasmataceae bacterium]|nr:helix-turn-helix transcriptional regulator [Acholeplasmataceae bacterium]